MGIKHINHTITSNEGCKFHIVGDVEYSFFPPSITGFSGTVTMSGGGKCSNGTVTFGIANPGGTAGNGNDSVKDISIKMDNKNIYKMKEIGWEKNLKSVPIQLDTNIINNALLNEFQSLEVEMNREYEVLKEVNFQKNSHKNVSVNVNVSCK